MPTRSSRAIARGGLAALLACACALLSRSALRAEHDLYQYKFPCNPADACYVTQLNHSGAFDIDPKGSAGLGEVRAVSEGIFRGYFVQANQCIYPTTVNRAGQYAQVDDMHGRTLIYAHLSAFGSFQAGQRVLQGDLIGIEGNTGNTQNCAPHLHLGGIASAPGIDGIATSEITAGPTLYRSTNSPAGAYSSAGASIRQRYFSLGIPYTSWATVGWTADATGSQEGCAPDSRCRLHPHHVPDPAAGHWGTKQDFRGHPDERGLAYTSIQVGRWAVQSAYWVRRAHFIAWLFGGVVEGEPGVRRRIGMPLMDEIGPFPNLCETARGCVAYQRFHAGYIWTNVAAESTAVFCPDVFPAYPVPDYVVTASDIFMVVTKFGVGDPAAPSEPWPDAWYDIDGSGSIAVGDIALVAGALGTACYAR